jgi:hypothetical protein
MSELVHTADLLFTGKDPTVRQTYERLLTVLASCGPFTPEAKKTSIHLIRTSGFAGVHPRKSYLILNLRLARPLDGPRIAKTEQVSKHRWHNEIRLDTPEQIDAELRGWLQEAYTLE